MVAKAGPPRIWAPIAAQTWVDPLDSEHVVLAPGDSVGRKKGRIEETRVNAAGGLSLDDRR
jgi:hypothetical protein